MLNPILSFRTVNSSTYGFRIFCLLEFFQTVTSESMFKKKATIQFSSTQTYYFYQLLTLVYVMFIITNSIKPRTGKLILNHLFRNNYQDLCNGLLGSYFFELTLGSNCLELFFWTVAFKTTMTQKYYKNNIRF